jgi:oxalate decarboxylase/phosphoglucose isomerase-like protein (cupin superfamily)
MLVQNIGDTDMQLFSVFATFKFAEFSLSDWLAHSPAGMVGRASERRFWNRSAPAWNRRAHQNLMSEQEASFVPHSLHVQI